MQMKDMLVFYSNIVARCTEDCVSSFRTTNLDNTEKTCIDRCTKKFMALAQRVELKVHEEGARRQSEGM